MILPLNKILVLLIRYKYLLIFPISIVEGPIISVIGGLLASQGYLNIYVVIAVLVLGDLVGDTIYYAIGRWGGHLFIRKWGKFFRIDDAKVEKLQSTFLNHGPKILIFGKSQGFGSAILFAAGTAKMSFVKFFWYNFISTVVKTIILVLVGYYFGMAYEKIDNYITKIGLVSLFVILVIAISYYLYKQKKA